MLRVTEFPGQSNEMFSDFSQHVIGVPQIAPAAGDPAAGNVTFDGPGQNEDFGLEQITGDANDRYKFRTSPLRNVALQPTFFHNGAFTRIEDAIRHHLDVFASVNNYDPQPLVLLQTCEALSGQRLRFYRGLIHSLLIRFI